MKLVKHIANLGYGSRKDVQWMFREGRITDAAGEVLYADDPLDHDNVRVDGEPLDLPPGLLLMLNKPVGYTCSMKDRGRVVFDLLPPRFRERNPALSTVGRLDRETSGLLLFTDDGQLLHRIISPKSKLPKVYLATLAEDLRGDLLAIVHDGRPLMEAVHLRGEIYAGPQVRRAPDVVCVPRAGVSLTAKFNRTELTGNFGRFGCHSPHDALWCDSEGSRPERTSDAGAVVAASLGLPEPKEFPWISPAN